jgi:predicted NAD-dependent protein-ADP-ribosyltransferase YbiA (DUF1768 family)
MQALAEGIIDSLTPKEASAAASPAASPAQAEAEAEQPAPKVKRPRQEAIPKDSAGFFRARAKDPRRFTFTADGDLQVPEMRGEASKVIKLPYYRPATVDQIREEEEKQIEQIKQVEKEIDQTSRSLRDAMAEWRKGAGGADEVMKLQRDLQRLDAQRTQLRSPIRWTKTFKNLSIRDVLVEEVYEVKKLGYPVEALRTRCLSTEQTIRSSDEKPFAQGAETEGEEEEEAEAEAEEFTVFFKPADPEHGFLSPDTLVDFIFNTRQYNCVTQAYQAERIIYMKREGDLLNPLLKTRSAPMMRVIGSKVVGQLPDPKETMTNILKSLVSQHPRFGDMLRATDGSTLVYADPRDGVLGIGIPVEDPQVTDRAAWKGTNFLGQAWQAVRDSLGPLGAQAAQDEARIEEEAPLVQEGGARGKTLADAKKQRTGVLIGRYRKAF